VVYYLYFVYEHHDNQSMTYLKAHEWLRCIRSERSKKLVEISQHKMAQNKPKD
jgi:hypothetical protein